MTIFQNLPDGLILRSVTVDDTENLAAFQTENMHFPMGFHIREWLRGDHPTSAIEGFTLVEESATGEIVSAACLLPQILTYDGIPFKAGCAEAVATRPEYRRRGLVRAQFDYLHRRAESEGQRMQIVQGATWLYRQFGYQPALENYGCMNSGGRLALPQRFPRLGENESEFYTVRLAEAEDLPFVRSLFARSRERYCLAAVETEAVWEYLLRGGEPGYNRWYDLRVITDHEGQRVGFVVHDPWGCGRVFLYEVAPDVSWLMVTPSVIRAIDKVGRCMAEANNGAFEGVAFCLAPRHPVFQVAPNWLAQTYDRHCEWGIRIADILGFVRHIAPVLSARLVDSPVAGHSGELHLNFYRTGLKLTLENGAVTSTEAWVPPGDREGDAGFTGTLFLLLLLGHRSLDEISFMDRDCWVGSNTARVLLTQLFPKQDSHIGTLA